MLEGFHKGDGWTEMITESLSSIWREPFSLKKDLSSLQALCPILHTVPVPSAAPHMFQCPFMPWMPFCPYEGARTTSLQLYGEESWFQRESMLNWDSILISLWTQRAQESWLALQLFPFLFQDFGEYQEAPFHLLFQSGVSTYDLLKDARGCNPLNNLASLLFI